MSETMHTIAQLPLRVYTPIQDLLYNESVADDIRELPDFLNVDVGEIQNLAPVVCQTHEPHESLRTVPWVKPTVAAKMDGEVVDKPSIQRGVWQWLNGRWVSMIPEYQTLAAIEDEVDVAVGDIDDFKTSVDAYAADVALVKGDVSDLRDDCVALNSSTLAHLAKTHQFAINQNFLHGTDEAIIPAGQGVTIPLSTHEMGSVQRHAVINFTVGDNQVYESRNTLGNRYRTFCLPALIMGGGRELTNSKVVQKGSPDGILMTYYPNYAQWCYYRAVWQWWGASKYPDIAFPEYTEAEWCENFGYYCSKNGVEYRDPCVIIEFAWDQPSGDTHPHIYSWPLVELVITGGTDPEPMNHHVYGFRVWFSNLDYSTWPAAPNGPMAEERRIKFHWSVYGKRRTPPEIWT